MCPSQTEPRRIIPSRVTNTLQEKIVITGKPRHYAWDCKMPRKFISGLHTWKWAGMKWMGTICQRMSWLLVLKGPVTRTRKRLRLN